MRIDLAAPLPALMRAVYAIKSSKPYLFVVGAGLKSSPVGLQSKVEQPVLQVQLDAYGATLVGGPAMRRRIAPITAIALVIVGCTNLVLIA